MTTIRPDGLNNPLSINSGIGATWRDAERRCEESDAVESYEDRDGGLAIEWTDGSEDVYRDPQAALIAIRQMEAN